MTIQDFTKLLERLDKKNIKPEKHLKLQEEIYNLYQEQIIFNSRKHKEISKQQNEEENLNNRLADLYELINKL